MYGGGCPGDIPERCYEARRALKPIPANAVEVIAEKDARIAALEKQLAEARSGRIPRGTFTKRTRPMRLGLDDDMYDSAGGDP